MTVSQVSSLSLRGHVSQEAPFLWYIHKSGSSLAGTGEARVFESFTVCDIFVSALLVGRANIGYKVV